MTANQTLTTNAVRRAFVFNCLDARLVRIFVGPKRLTITGTIERLPEHESPITHATLCSLEADIMNTSGIRNIQWRLENWVHELGAWRSTRPQRTRKRGSRLDESTGDVGGFGPRG